MKVLVAHNSYQVPGGEDIAVENDLTLLRSQGHEVDAYFVSNLSIGTPGNSSARVARELTHSARQYALIVDRLAQFRPDVVHVHNTFPLITPAIYLACADAGIPVVQTLHNYRPLCANALLLRDGKPCDLCVTASPYIGSWFGCYRGSRLATLPVSHLIAQQRRTDGWRHIRRFIAPSTFVKQKFIAGGFPAHKITVKPHYVPDPFPNWSSRPDPDSAGPSFVYVGRLSAEKGVTHLLGAWRELPRNFRLKMLVRRPANPSGEFTEFLREIEAARGAGLAIELVESADRTELFRQIHAADFSIHPSLCYETFGLSVAESFASGTPTIVTRHGALAELVAENQTGFLVPPHDAPTLAKTLQRAAQADRAKMSAESRAYFEAHFTPKHQIQALLEIYRAPL